MLIIFSLTLWDQKGEKMVPWLGLFTILMGILFAVVVYKLARQDKVAWVSLAPSLPEASPTSSEPAKVSTTTIWLNLLKGSNLAKIKELKEA